MRILHFIPLLVLSFLRLNLEIQASPTSYRGESPRLKVELPSQVDKRQNGHGGGFSWGHDPMRGVNIGGWLVLEPWITPSLFLNKPDWVVDEWTYGIYMNYQNDTMGEIRRHWNTWFKYEEMKDIAAVGLNTIRIQIGFWSVIPLENGEPYLVGQ
uniref:Glycoside hydrolase family 5 domain-containing protein n=1 Tax=Kwoniella bestiolae CBS 10118 TaxID=1296100 RepID=A0A1B9G5A8_9TREE|nr:hypothetical protein I302_03896 [Kwoniella bestiolae CBS 10118]OCF26217.1 hypothetical protein I302_03896 [Kwoniella bestiolae CBS 10118]